MSFPVPLGLAPDNVLYQVLPITGGGTWQRLSEAYQRPQWYDGFFGQCLAGTRVLLRVDSGWSPW